MTTMTETTDAAVDDDRLRQFMERYAADQAATMHAARVVVGDQLGLYRALADGGAQSAAQLARAIGCQPRLIREWLNAQFRGAEPRPGLRFQRTPRVG